LLLQSGDRDFEIHLPLLEVGRFQAKAFVEPADGTAPIWAEGGDLVIKVEPAEYCCSSTIYSAFVRLFGDHRLHGSEEKADSRTIAHLEHAGYEVIPRSGTFRDLIAELDHITGDLGFRIVQLLPVFPTPTTYARMGRFGSPFAALDFMDVDPALAEFDRKTTPLEQFCELVDAVHHRGAKLFLDVPINHTGWASWLQTHHPEWFKRHEETGFASPGAWGVTWADLAELDYHDRELWRYMAGVFLLWCRKGVDGFRCDAGYMVPLPVWTYITAKVRSEFPDTVFLLEGLGGDKRLVFDLLDRANLNWAYSELFQNFTRKDVESILSENIRVSQAEGVQAHFFETHDNNRLAAKSHLWAGMRTSLAALCSHSGAFGITCGVEWFAKEKIDVHEAHSLNWGNPENQVAKIRKLNAILATHPAFWHGAKLTFIGHGSGNVLTLKRTAQEGDHSVLVVVNLDTDSSAGAAWEVKMYTPTGLWDLLAGERVKIETDKMGIAELALNPGEVRCLCDDPSWLEALEFEPQTVFSEPKRSQTQRARAKVLELRSFFRSNTDSATKESMDEEVAEWSEDPRAFCEKLAGNGISPERCCLIGLRNGIGLAQGGHHVRPRSV